MSILNKLTLQHLRLNKKRTVVTIIGVILSVAMLSAITTFAASMQDLMIRGAIEGSGSWHVKFSNVEMENSKYLTENAKTKTAGILMDVGYAPMAESRNKEKPYLFVRAYDTNALNMMAVNLVQGRLPENEHEIVLPEHLKNNGGVTIPLGSEITLPMGSRSVTREQAENPEEYYSMGDTLGQMSDEELSNLSQKMPYFNGEAFVPSGEERSFTVVGIMERPNIERYSAPGFTAITYLDDTALAADSIVEVAVEAKNPRTILEDGDEMALSAGSAVKKDYNSDLLMYMGISGNNGFNAVLYSISGILIGLILVGSISLIYNSFAISVSERGKQFGMLSSVGATKRQIRKMVFFEGAIISLIGIPLGLLAGVFGIGATLYLIQPLLTPFMNIGGGLTLVVSPASIVSAAILGFVTVMISAYVPAARASRVTAIEAIRQTKDVTVTAKSVKSPRIIRKLFGIEGELAYKNLRRSKKRYRATIFSLFISIVLFLAVTSFTTYLGQSTSMYYTDVNYDVNVIIQDPETAEAKQFTENAAALEGIDSFAQVQSRWGTTENLSSSDLTAQAREALQTDSGIYLEYSILAYDEANVRDLAKRVGIDGDQLFDPNVPKGIFINHVVYENFENDGDLRINEMDVFAGVPAKPLDVKVSSFDDNGESYEQKTSVAIAALTTERPLGLPGGSAALIVSREVFETMVSDLRANEDFRDTSTLYFKTENPGALENSLQELRLSSKATVENIFNIAEQAQMNRNMMTIVSVFVYGFIALITLIGVANVFNTISTNVSLRRREFAMLKSVGMTPRGFSRMLNFESLFYGLKSLIYGIPAGILASLGLFAAMRSGIGITYSFQWLYVVICIVAVFAIVFITMLYSSAKFKKENIIEALKEENN